MSGKNVDNLYNLYNSKYLKYKNKYLSIKKLVGGGVVNYNVFITYNGVAIMNPINDGYFVIDENSSLLETVAKILNMNPLSIIAEFNEGFLKTNWERIRYDCEKKIDEKTTLKNSVGNGVVNVDIDVRDKDHNPVRQGVALATPRRDVVSKTLLTQSRHVGSAKASDRMLVDYPIDEVADLNILNEHIRSLERLVRNKEAEIAFLTRNSTRNPTTVPATGVGGLMAPLLSPIVRDPAPMVRVPAPGGPIRKEISRSDRFKPY